MRIRSDGADTLKVMADATRERGYDYLGLTDHSQTAHYEEGEDLARAFFDNHTPSPVRAACFPAREKALA